MFLLQQFAPGVIAAGMVAFAASLVTRWLAANWARQLLFALAAGGGYAAGHAKSVGWPGFPPADSTQWLAFSALAAIVLGFVYGASRDRWAIGRIASFAALLFGTLALLLTPKFKYGWTAGQGAAWVTALALAAAAVGWALDGTLRQPGRFSLLSLLAVGIGTSIALALSGSVLLGQLAAVLAAVVFGLVAASVAGAMTECAIVPGVATLLIGLIACGYFYAELPGLSALLLVAAPALSLLVRGEASARRDLIRAVIAAAAVAGAVALAFRASPPMEYY